MKSLTEYLHFNTKTRRAFVNITPQVEKLVQKSNVQEGLCLVNAMHITPVYSLMIMKVVYTKIMKNG